MNSTHNPEDKALLNKIRKGNFKAFDKLFSKYSKKLYSFSYHYLYSGEDAKDIVQEVFLRLWKMRHKLDPKLSVYSLIITIAKNLIFNQLQKKVSAAKHFDSLSSKSLHSNNTEEYIIFSELETNLNKSIEKLPSRCKQVFMLSRQNGLTTKEIADKLNLSKSTVENQISAALKALKKDLPENQILLVILSVSPFL